MAAVAAMVPEPEAVVPQQDRRQEPVGSVAMGIL
jgi:hypothetical protein